MAFAKLSPSSDIADIETILRSLRMDPEKSIEPLATMGLSIPTPDGLERLKQTSLAAFHERDETRPTTGGVGIAVMFLPTPVGSMEEFEHKFEQVANGGALPAESSPTSSTIDGRPSLHVMLRPTEDGSVKQVICINDEVGILCLIAEMGPSRIEKFGPRIEAAARGIEFDPNSAASRMVMEIHHV